MAVVEEKQGGGIRTEEKFTWKANDKLAAYEGMNMLGRVPRSMRTRALVPPADHLHVVEIFRQLKLNLILVWLLEWSQRACLQLLRGREHVEGSVMSLFLMGEGWPPGDSIYA